MIRNSPCMKIGDVLRQLFPRNWSQRTCGSRIFQELWALIVECPMSCWTLLGCTWVEWLNAQSPTAALTCSFGHNWVVLSFVVMDSILEVVVVASVVRL
jgi:hypothetical protein